MEEIRINENMKKAENEQIGENMQISESGQMRDDLQAIERGQVGDDLLASEKLETGESAKALEEVFELIPELRMVEHRDENSWREIKSYVLRGQRLKQYQIDALKTYFYDYAIVHSFEKLDFYRVFGNDNPVVIEIGFGMGESTARIARENPNINYLGIEVFLYGFSKLLATIAKENLTNLRIMRYDAVQVLEDMIEDDSVSGFHIFFPDPWPKKRHHKKRLVQLPFTTLLAQKLKKGGYIYCVTDWEDYANQMLSVLEATPGMVNPYAGECAGFDSLSDSNAPHDKFVPRAGFAPPRPWRPETSFERKGLDKSYTINEVWVEKA